MKQRLLKDLEALRWYFLGALALTVAAATNGGLDGIFPMFAGASILAVAIWGNEFNHQTMGQLLAQPISRRRLWYEKMAILFCALGVLLVAYFWSSLCWFVWSDYVRVDHALTTPLVLISLFCAFSFGPWITLVCRNSLLSFIFSMAIPWFAGMLLYLLANLCFAPEFFVFENDQLIYFGVLCPVAALAAMAYLMGCRQFQRLEVLNVLAREIHLPLFTEWFGQRRKSLTAHTSIPVLSLFRKELGLHEVNALLALAFTGGCFLVFLIKWLHPSTDSDGDLIVFPLTLYAVMLPITTGAVVVAEERQMGIFEWQLVQPPSSLKQWIIKVLAANFVFLTLGFCLMHTWRIICREFLYYHNPVNLDAEQFMKMTPICIWLVNISIMASSLSSTPLRSMVLSLALLASTILLGNLGIWDAFRAGGNSFSEVGCFFLSTGAAVLLIIPYLNFKRNDTGPWRLVCQSSVVILISVILLKTYSGIALR